MLPVSALRDFRPLVCTPSHDGKYFHNYIVSLLNLQAHSVRLGLDLQISLHAGESLITRARNNCVAAFLANPAWTHLIWIDSDIGFSPDAVFRLLLSNHDIAAGVYPLKYENWPAEGVPADTTREEFNARHARYTVNTDANPDGKVVLDIDEDGFLTVTEAPTGFMAIRREVFLAMMQHYPELRYVPDSIGHEDQGLHYRFFDVMVHPVSRRYLSEDYGFCWLWSQMGGKIHLDANSNLSHQGQKLYRGDFAASLAANLPGAVGAPVGLPMELHGMQYLHANPAGPA